MSGNSEKAAGAANAAISNAKQVIGRATGSDRLKFDGAVQELKGEGRKATGNAKNTLKEASGKTAGALKKSV